jgi:hypothetical protein
MNEGPVILSGVFASQSEGNSESKDLVSVPIFTTDARRSSWMLGSDEELVLGRGFSRAKTMRDRIQPRRGGRR